MRQLITRLSKAGKVKVGVLQGSGAASGGGISMVHLAAIHEFGSPAAGIPERSFIRRTFNRKRFQRSAAALSAKLARQVLLNKMSTDQALGLLGAWAQAEIKKTITEGRGVPPPNAPATIARKGSSRTLVHHGRLINSLTWKVAR